MLVNKNTTANWQYFKMYGCYAATSWRECNTVLTLYNLTDGDMLQKWLNTTARCGTDQHKPNKSISR